MENSEEPAASYQIERHYYSSKVVKYLGRLYFIMIEDQTKRICLLNLGLDGSSLKSLELSVYPEDSIYEELSSSKSVSLNSAQVLKALDNLEVVNDWGTEDHKTSRLLRAGFSKYLERILG